MRKIFENIIRCVAVSSTGFCFSMASAFAAPTVQVTPAGIDNFHSIVFTFFQEDAQSVQACHYNLFAADRASDLKSLPGRGLSIATFYRPLPEVQIIASPLPHLAPRLNHPTRKFATLYFRVLVSCPIATDGYSEIFSIRVPTFSDAKIRSVDKMNYEMKTHMQYYEPPTENE